MRHPGWIGLWILACLAACEPEKPPARPRPPLLKPAFPASIPAGAAPARVRGVYDGDTLTLQDGAKVRLLGVDTPELRGEDGRPEPFSAEARDFTRALCESREVALEFDVERQDRYGRLLCFVYVRDGETVRMVNAELLREGLGRVYTPGPNARHKEFLLQCQREAREEGRGTWKDYVFGQEKAYYAARRGHAFHRAGCESLKNSKDLRTFKDQKEAMDAGLSPCRNCRP